MMTAVNPLKKMLLEEVLKEQIQRIEDCDEQVIEAFATFHTQQCLMQNKECEEDFIEHAKHKLNLELHKRAVARSIIAKSHIE